MSRILKRPMFRIGGSASEGIVSMAQPRKNYQEGSDYSRRIAELKPVLREALGPGRSERDRLLDMLLRGSIRLASERPVGGGIIPTIAKSFQEPVEQYLKSGETEEALQRQIDLTAATQGISSVEAERLQRMKVDAAQAEARQRAEQVDKELFLKTSGLGTSASSIYDTKRALERKGEVVIGAVPTVGSGDQVKPTPSSVLSIPEGRVFYDVNGNFYRRVAKDESNKLGWKRIQLSGEDIKAGAPVKPTGFFGEVKEKGAAYDPRSWNKQKFYESLAKKNPPSTME
jgi:hypothetical protein